MCGGCSTGGARDWAAGLVVTPEARTAVASAATSLCRTVGAAARIDVGAGGWLVSAPTGAVVVVSTVTQLWAAVATWPARTAERGVPPLDHLTSTSPRTSELAPLPTGRRVAVLVGEPAAPERAWADDVVEGSQPYEAVIDDVDATAPWARVLISCSDSRQAQGLVTALRGPGPAQRWSLNSLVARGRCGDGWADSLDGAQPADAASLLDGDLPAIAAGRVLHGAAHPAAVACWVGAVLADGGVEGRLRITTSAGLVIDLLGQTVLGLRPALQVRVPERQRLRDR